MKIEWDPQKRSANLKKHGIDFVDAANVFEGLTKTMSDDRDDYGEARFVTFGLLEGRVVAVVHTESADSIRVISMRKATKREEEAYFDEI